MSSTRSNFDPIGIVVDWELLESQWTAFYRVGWNKNSLCKSANPCVTAYTKLLL
jgi:hypothetical protein